MTTRKTITPAWTVVSCVICCGSDASVAPTMQRMRAMTVGVWTALRTPRVNIMFQGFGRIW
jgi:hypothetical protein